MLRPFPKWPTGWRKPKIRQTILSSRELQKDSLNGLVYQLSKDYTNSHARKFFNFLGSQYSEDKSLILRESFSIHDQGLNLSAGLNPSASAQEEKTEKKFKPIHPQYTKKDRKFSIFSLGSYRKISDLSFSSETEFDENINLPLSSEPKYENLDRTDSQVEKRKLKKHPLPSRQKIKGRRQKTFTRRKAQRSNTQTGRTCFIAKKSLWRRCN